ncbi:hypothetical protein F7R21_11825 [Burkholderia latens]|uniref:Uncharacterized protein n=1 Tax=Burkholderia latens TaxID=488446 RepID=A0A6H9ST20_9BURK|nr:hypothetical protein F7R21_11825 [Burkholderia latens]
MRVFHVAESRLEVEAKSATAGPYDQRHRTLMVQIRAKAAISRGLFAGIRQCRETTARGRPDYAHLPPVPTKRPVTTLTRQVLAPHRGLHYTPLKRRKSVFTRSCPPPDIHLAPHSPSSRRVP